MFWSFYSPKLGFTKFCSFTHQNLGSPSFGVLPTRTWIHQVLEFYPPKLGFTKFESFAHQNLDSPSFGVFTHQNLDSPRFGVFTHQNLDSQSFGVLLTKTWTHQVLELYPPKFGFTKFWSFTHQSLDSRSFGFLPALCVHVASHHMCLF